MQDMEKSEDAVEDEEDEEEVLPNRTLLPPETYPAFGIRLCSLGVLDAEHLCSEGTLAPLLLYSVVGEIASPSSMNGAFPVAGVFPFPHGVACPGRDGRDAQERVQGATYVSERQDASNNPRAVHVWPGKRFCK